MHRYLYRIETGSLRIKCPQQAKKEEILIGGQPNDTGCHLPSCEEAALRTGGSIEAIFEAKDTRLATYGDSVFKRTGHSGDRLLGTGQSPVSIPSTTLGGEPRSRGPLIWYRANSAVLLQSNRG